MGTIKAILTELVDKAPALACSRCGAGITRGSRTGLCFPCYHNSGRGARTAAELASRSYFEAIEAYRAKHEPWTLRGEAR